MMDKLSEKGCLEEISTLVLDSQEKVTLKTISNNWAVTNQQAQDVLSKWISSNVKNGNDFQIEFLVRGKNSKGILSFSVVIEEKKKLLEKKWTDFSSWVYSVEPRISTRTLGVLDFEEIKVKNIVLNNLPPRDIKVPELPIPRQEQVKQEPTKSKTPSFFKPQVKKEVPEKKISPLKVEPKTEKEVEVKKPSPDVKKPVESQKKNAKNQKPTQKGSISSFFNNKPSSSTSSKSETNEPKVKPLKRESSPEVAEEPPKKKKAEQKKLKLKELPNKKRSRIQVIEDSSEEEEEQDESEPETKLIKFDKEVTPEPDVKKSPIKEEAKSVEKVTNGKRKAKRWVKKRFMTESGFMRTENVQEEYTASEDENDENKKKNSPETKSSKKIEVKTVEKKSAEKKKPTAKPTQSNKITSFFTKK